MGCSVSSEGNPCKEHSDWAIIRKDGDTDGQKGLPVDDLTREDVYKDLALTGRQTLIVRASWLRLQPNLTAVGKQVFLRIFEFRPSVKRMFPFRDAWGDQLIKHPEFVEQARRFMQVINCVVNGLDFAKSRSAERLVMLGRKHVIIEGFLPDYFDVFTRAILSVWKQELKEDYTEETAEAWTLLFAFIIDNLKIGYEAEFKLRFQNSN